MAEYELYHGDCLEVMKTLEAGSVDFILTDPPYGTTACKWDTVIPFEPMWERIKHVIKPRGAVALFGSEPFSSMLRVSNLKWYKYDWVWDKVKGTGFQISKYRPLMRTENILIFGKSSVNYSPIMKRITPKRDSSANTTSRVNPVASMKKFSKIYTHRFPTNILKYKRDSGHHPTQKPVSLLEYLVKTYTNEGDTVLDFTAGSGSTGVACALTHRRFIGIEQDAEYFRIAEQRVKNAYGEFVITDKEKAMGQMALFDKPIDNTP